MSAMKLTAELADGSIHEVEVKNPERVRWDITRAKHNWPTANEAPFLMTTFMAWASLKRLGIYSGTFEDFRDTDCVDLDAEGDDAEVATP